jgi:aryl-alcohol dehydrogenase-like predicted oxidoreductase
VSPIGFGAFKIGRNRGIKYPLGYELPDDDAVAALLDGVLDLGINLIDTAPAYGTSEERIGRALAGRRSELVLSTKVGEAFGPEGSTYDFSRDGVRRSVERSRRRLATDVIDVLLVHSDGNDLVVLNETDVVETLLDLRREGAVRAVGFSGRTVAGARAALAWADVLMVEYSPAERDHEPVLAEAAARNVGVLVKKGLGSGHLAAAEAIPFVLANPAVSSLVVGGLNLEHIRANVEIARA